MTDAETKYRLLVAICLFVYGPFFGPLMAARFWSMTR
jgi:hypothetical protein